MKKEERFYERIVLILLLLGTFILYCNASRARSVTTGTDMTSMDFPKGILILLAVLCGVRLIGNLIQSAKEKEEKQKVSVDKRTWITAIGIFLYAIMWKIFGFFLSSCTFFFLESLVLKRDVCKKQAVLISVGITTFIYIVFGMAFGVDFPEPLLELVMI
ncbi:MAG: tripartite tricarboxylate transporter TctB family protein [Lachnospiraceae bacterium]